MGWERLGEKSADVSAQSGGREECGGMTPLFGRDGSGGVSWDGADMSAPEGVPGWERVGGESADVSAQSVGREECGGMTPLLGRDGVVG
ncbi:hypothetical protein HNR46_000482 [Haloferula luteola]|uniref:Uncharacterized protein n=1 Tax=Haloferula luteola TaxID=595692 RepID=A0A840V646_9BACT|nr:hypothetical protein [Haloferula luteola]